MRRPNRQPRQVEPEHQINDRIRVPKVRVVGEGEPQVLSTTDALKIAREEGLDLVMISEKADPPVCKILDYKKFLYDQKKKQKEIKNNAQKVVVKEIRFGPNTDEHDFEFKKKHAVKFLEEGSKIKSYVFFKGRSILFKDKGEILLLRLATEVEELGIVESMPKLEGKRMIMMLAPKKKK
ncbi:MAG: translation initiation factor IF-3 [Salibacteraceae bacterium]|nr:translation initiation factor IF-3 [Salibacteraceae bacterium]MDP4686959.1 translation initiation factor IF-3 [Salibacteraceae bacterium]MDP4763490.1 translation initiation factor IF-3 [Salibacteraceae bacterium]MDP4844838.1 translation initiation factor IF-3 [Salibacteraceae bacterium]MDP4934297.1 translation initiation factor IF-3 [Salibacteraceae bacterium]